MILILISAALILIACLLFYKSLTGTPDADMRQGVKDEIMSQINKAKTINELFKVYSLIPDFYREFANPQDKAENALVMQDLYDLNAQFDWKRKTLA